MPDRKAPFGSSLFQQLSIVLILLVVIFGVFNAGLVVALYANDPGQLARSLVQSHAREVARSLGSGHSLAATKPGTQRQWVARDAAGTLLASGGPALSPVAAFGTEEWTRNRTLGDDLRVAGVTPIRRHGQTLWVGVALVTPVRDAYVGPILLELGEHVFVPLVPLSLLLLGFSLWQVRRLTAPLRQAVRDVEALNPQALSDRLRIPTIPFELRVLVLAINGALARIEKSTRLVRDFNANMAHELRTPLAVLRLSVSELPAGKGTAKLDAQLNGLTRTIEQMLEMAQAEAPLPDGAGPLDLNDLAGEVVAQLAPLAWASDRELQLSEGEAGAVTGHAEAIQRALRNLIENAIRHTPAGAAVDVRVGPGARISVRDHGPGVPAEHRARVFDRFWRADRGRQDGSGLGLGIARAIMESHGGRVLVEDADGGGALFILDFEGQAADQDA